MNVGIGKQPFKVIEIPLNKFNDEAIPHHQKVFEVHKTTIQKCISTKNVEQLKKEIKDKKRIVRQLKDLIYELETLRARVEDCDLDRFDEKTFSLRKIITSLVKDYGALEKSAQVVIDASNIENENVENQNPFEAASQLQVQVDIDELKIKEHQDKLQKVEALNEDIQDLHGMFIDLNKMVGEQGENVEVIENNVETTQENVNAGLRHLVKACKLQTAAYPVTGALLGGIIGGPLGCVAGFKAGGLAALGCGLAGYTGGKLFKKYNEEDIQTTEQTVLEKSEVQTPDNETNLDKNKDI